MGVIDGWEAAMIGLIVVLSEGCAKGEHHAWLVILPKSFLRRPHLITDPLLDWEQSGKGEILNSSCLREACSMGGGKANAVLTIPWQSS